MDSSTKQYNVPIWLSNWVFKDGKNKKYTLYNIVVKGHTKGEIFTNKKIVNKIVNKIKGGSKKRKIVPVNLSLISQHGYGINDN